MTEGTPQFANMELLVNRGQPGNYPAMVIASPAGEATGALALDPNSPEIVSALNAIANGNTTDDSLRQFGRRLFDALLADPIGDLYNKSLGLAQGAGKRLRLRLRIEPPEISALPWEYLYDPGADLPFAISPKHCLSRYTPISEPAPALPVERPLRVLVVVSDPPDLSQKGLPPLNAAEEINRIKTALRQREDAGQVKTDVLPHAIAADLRDKLRMFRPHIVHLIGHGGFQNDQGMVVMEDESNHTRLVSDRQFREFFLGADDARLVVLNACQGATQSSARALAGVAPQIVRRGLGAVVAMQYPIPDKVALSFAREFYRALAEYYPVDAAVTEGRRAVYMDFGSDRPDWATPVIFMRSPDGVLFSPPAISVAPKQAGQGDTGQGKDIYIEGDVAGRRIYDPSRIPMEKQSVQGGGGVNIQAKEAHVGGDVAGRDIVKSNVSSASARRDSGASLAGASPMQLRDLLDARFDLEELRTLCFEISVDWDSLPGEGKVAKARELIGYLQRRDRLPDLIAAIRCMRPDI